MGDRIKFLADNFLDSIINFDFSSENPSFPAQNLLNPFRSKIWRSYNYFLINTSNNGLVINDGSDKFIELDLTEHSSGASLASNIQTKLNALSSNFTVSYSLTTNKFTISRTTSFTIKWTDPRSTLYETIGFDGLSDLSGSSSYISDELRTCYPAEWIKLDHGVTRNPKAICIFDDREDVIKLSPSVTFKVQGAYSDAWNNPEQVNVNYNQNMMATINMNGIFTNPYRYHRFYLPDIINPLGYLQIGKLYVGDVYEVESSDIQRDFEESTIDFSEVERSISGEFYADEKSSITVFGSINIQLCNKNDVDMIKTIWDRHRTYKPFIVSIDSELKATSDISEWTKYVRFTEPPRFQTVTCDSWNITLALEEVL